MRKMQLRWPKWQSTPIPPHHPPRVNIVTGQPIFAQPKPSPDPSGFKDPVTDQKYQELTTLGTVPQPRGGRENPS
jgi:hypothetical protein